MRPSKTYIKALGEGVRQLFVATALGMVLVIPPLEAHRRQAPPQAESVRQPLPALSTFTTSNREFASGHMSGRKAGSGGSPMRRHEG